MIAQAVTEPPGPAATLPRGGAVP